MNKELANIVTSPLEEVMHECFLPYAEYVILERALPRVEDGLKPVQRRILYAMYEMGIFSNTKHKKCARIVGETMGKFHPHGDTSIYEALARMAQDFSMSMTLIDGQGNFGSIDGDGPAAMRYTEARLSEFAFEMLRDIEKDTVPFQLNFDDTMKEPLMLPSRFPNLLVNGASGIAVSLATNIPPHNLGEVIDGVVYRMKNPRCTIGEVMKYIKAPDFPTGGILYGLEGLKEAYATGRGKITLRAKTSFEATKSGKPLIVVTELPYEVRESAMLKKIQNLRESKKEMFATIDSVRSETDRTGIRAVIELKKGADEKKILDCLFKYSDLQITYGLNMVAIADGQPKQLGILQILDYYIAYQRKVVTRRVRYDIEQAQEKEHKLAGLIIAVKNIDLVIKIIRSSENTREAKASLMARLSLTGVQAQAILDMRLAKLTKLEIDELLVEYEKVIELLKYLNEILASREKLDGVIIDEIKKVKNKYSIKRRTAISGESAEVTIDLDEFKTVEDCVVVLTRGGGLKRMSPKAYTLGVQSGEPEEKNKPAFIVETNTASKLLAFTTHGSLFNIAVESIKEAKYKDAGSPLVSVLAGMEKGESILLLTPPLPHGELLTVSGAGQLKYTDMAEFDTKKRQISACGLKDKDSLIYAALSDGTQRLLLVTSKGMSILIKKDEIVKQGRSGTGVGGIKLSPGDSVVFAAQLDEGGEVAVFSDTGYMKKTMLSEYEVQGRNGKGQKTFIADKNSAGSVLVAGSYFNSPAAFTVVFTNGETSVISSADIPREAKASTGMQLVFPAKGEKVKCVYV